MDIIRKKFPKKEKIKFSLVKELVPIFNMIYHFAVAITRIQFAICEMFRIFGSCFITFSQCLCVRCLITSYLYI